MTAKRQSRRRYWAMRLTTTDDEQQLIRQKAELLTEDQTVVALIAAALKAAYGIQLQAYTSEQATQHALVSRLAAQMAALRAYETDLVDYAQRVRASEMETNSKRRLLNALETTLQLNRRAGVLMDALVAAGDAAKLD